MSKLLTIAVSTVSSNLNELISYISDIKGELPEEIGFMLVSQLESEESYSKVDDIDVFRTPESGLSKSRNFAISKCNSDWIWFQDDDINLIRNKVSSLLDFVRGFEGDLVLVKVASLENPDKDFKNYRRYKVNKRLLSFRISSIELIANVNFVRRNNVWFDENLGLGASRPSCEENLFFHDCIVENKARYFFYENSVCMHTTLSSTRNIDHERRYRARGYLLAKMGDVISPFLMIWWGVRKTSDGVSRRRRLFLMSSEYLKVMRCSVFKRYSEVA